MVSTLAPVFLVSAIVFVAFLILQWKLQRIYRPRTYLPALDRDERSPRSPGFMGWAKHFAQLSDEFVLGSSSLDNYLWLRFFKIMASFCLVGCCITWPILFPVNITGGGGEGGLNMLSFSNVQNPIRYLAHCFTAWLFLGFMMFVITRETMYYIFLRQAYLLSPFSTSRISSKTVLFTDVPAEYRDIARLRHVFPRARHVWLVHDVDDLADLVKEQGDNTNALEGAETKMISGCVKKQQKGGKDEESPHVPPSLNSKDRPTHRLKFLIGKKVDTIDWSRNELRRLIPRIANEQHAVRAGHAEKLGACFVEFDTVGAAHAAFQQVAHQIPCHMMPAEVGMRPDQVLWDNITLSWWNVKLRVWVCTAFVAFLCIFWTIPVAFIGFITNIPALTNTLPWLGFINSIPSSVIGVVTGLLPSVLLSVLMKLVPIICNMLAKTFSPTLATAQMTVQNWYFAFQVIQVFLITTFSSGASAVVQSIIQNPLQAPQLLAKNLPKASNFYISYFILYGLMTAAMQILNIMPLLMIAFLGKITDKTPRKMYNRYVALSGLGWGSLYPKYATLGVIGTR